MKIRPTPEVERGGWNGNDVNNRSKKNGNGYLQHHRLIQGGSRAPCSPIRGETDLTSSTSFQKHASETRRTDEQCRRQDLGRKQSLAGSGTSPDVQVFLEGFLPLVYSSTSQEWPQSSQVHLSEMECWILQRLCAASNPKKGAVLYWKFHPGIITTYRTVEKSSGFVPRSHFREFLSHLCINILASDVFERDEWLCFLSNQSAHADVFPQWCRILKDTGAPSGEVDPEEKEHTRASSNESHISSSMPPNRTSDIIRDRTVLQKGAVSPQKKRDEDCSVWVENLGDFLSLGNNGGEPSSLPSKATQPKRCDHLGVKIEGIEMFLSLGEPQKSQEVSREDPSVKLVDVRVLNESSLTTKKEREEFRFERSASTEPESDEEYSITEDSASNVCLAPSLSVRDCRFLEERLSRDDRNEAAAVRNTGSDDESIYDFSRLGD